MTLICLGCGSSGSDLKKPKRREEGMPDRADPNALPTLDEGEVTELVLSILLERHPALVAFDELVAEFPAADSDQAVPEAVIHDAIDELERLGLVHCLDRFLFASWRAIRAKQLVG
jgi:hypothetical protein